MTDATMNIRKGSFAIVALALVVAAGTGCGGMTGGNGGGGSAPSYKDQKLQGSVNGSEWVYTHGTVEDFSGSKNIELYAASDKPSDPCSFDTFNYEGWTVSFQAPAEENKWELSNSRMVNFSKAPDNVLTKTGWFEFTSVTDEQIKGKIVAKRDSENVVIGDFTAARCDNSGGGS